MIFTFFFKQKGRQWIRLNNLSLGFILSESFGLVCHIWRPALMDCVYGWSYRKSFDAEQWKYFLSCSLARLQPTTAYGKFKFNKHNGEHSLKVYIGTIYETVLSISHAYTPLIMFKKVLNYFFSATPQEVRCPWRVLFLQWRSM